VPPPHERATFEQCTLDDGEREAHAEAVALHRDLLRLRATDATVGGRGVLTDGAAIDAGRLVLRMRGPSVPDRLLVINLGQTFDLARISEPLIAPPVSGPWRVLWHSEDPAYGGSGMPPLDPSRWEMPGQSAVLLGAEVSFRLGDEK
jgi:maltooligosyltrehalose trehalohydrolase